MGAGFRIKDSGFSRFQCASPGKVIATEITENTEMIDFHDFPL